MHSIYSYYLASLPMFSTIESPSRNLASRERIYKNYGVAGPASALSSLSHKLKGGYACLHHRLDGREFE